LNRLGGKRITVTGGAGFLGSHVVKALEREGCAQVFVPRSKDYNMVDGDAVRRMYRDSKPDVVIHLAALVGGIGANQANPGRYLYDNTMMGLQLIETGRAYGIGKLVVIGTVCAYPKWTPTPFREDDLWAGFPEETNAPYGLAKRLLLVQCQAYRQQYGLNCVYLLPTNLYGPADNFDPATSHVIPALIKKVFDAREKGENHITVWGTGSPTREFLYVEDAAEGIVLATKDYDKPAPVNLGAGSEISIKSLAELICELCGFDGQIVWDSSRPDGQPRRWLDTARAREEFGFVARTPLREGLIRTIEWYRRHRAASARD